MTLWLTVKEENSSFITLSLCAVGQVVRVVKGGEWTGAEESMGRLVNLGNG